VAFAAQGVWSRRTEMQGEDDQMNLLLKRALSHPDRREALGYLMGSGEGVSESELADVLDLGRARLKYHLTVLRNADLIAEIEDVQEQGQGECAYVAAGFTSL
jgi:DNA-binding transcriptional ArsR family regulator